MDKIQPLNELNERMVSTEEVEGIKEQMVELAGLINAHGKLISPLEK